MNRKYCEIPCDFITAIGQAGISKLGYDLIFYILRLTYKRWIKYKTLESCDIDWIDLVHQKINRECWKKNGSKEIRRAFENLLPKNIIVFNSDVTKIRINYNYETWDI